MASQRKTEELCRPRHATEEINVREDSTEKECDTDQMPKASKGRGLQNKQLDEGVPSTKLEYQAHVI